MCLMFKNQEKRRGLYPFNISCQQDMNCSTASFQSSTGETFEMGTRKGIFRSETVYIYNKQNSPDNVI